MAEISINGSRIFYREAGEGPPLVLLHSGGGSGEEWDLCLGPFSDHYHVIAYDRWGYGRSQKPRTFEDDYFDRDVADLNALLEALGIGGNVFLCGFSDGGTIALLFTQAHPQRVSALICEGGHAYVEGKAIEGLQGLMAEYKQMATMEGQLQNPGARTQMAWLERWLSPSFRPWNIMNKLDGIHCPALIIQGTRDRFATIAQAENIAGSIKNSELWLVDGLGHRVHEKIPDEFVGRVTTFFKKRKR